MDDGRDRGDDGGDGRDAAAEPTLRLDDALKLTGAVATGGQAKAVVQSGRVTVNGVVETRRKRRLRAGDVIGFDGETFEIDLDE